MALKKLSILVLRRRLAFFVANLLLGREAKRDLTERLQANSGEVARWRSVVLMPALRRLKQQGRSDELLKKLRKPLAQLQELAILEEGRGGRR